MAEEASESKPGSPGDGLPSKFSKLDEGYYKSDLDILNRHQSFTGELLQISTAGIGVVGFFIMKLPAERPGAVVVFMLTLAALLFAATAACAMGHRYQSTKGFFHHTRYLRTYLVNPSGKKAIANETARAQHYKILRHLFTLATVFCGLAVMFVGGAWVALNPVVGIAALALFLPGAYFAYDFFKPVGADSPPNSSDAATP